MTPAEEHAPYDGDDDDVAAEYVLGVLPASERAAISRRIETEPAFARLVEAWEERLSPLDEAYQEVAPPATVKQALQQRLFEARERRGLPLLWQSLFLWRTLTALSLAAVALLGALYLAGSSGQPQQRLVASLAPTQSDVHYLVVYDARSGDIGLSHVSGARPQGQDFELWVIDNGQPHSLGIIPPGSSVHLAVTEALKSLVDTDATLAVTTEPEGGSPTGLPTGPVVAQGGLNAV